MFEILNGRSSFWQWDINQKLVVQDLPNGAEVHFSNCNSDYALVTLVKTVDGKNVCDVPNVVLQKAGYVNVFAYVIEGEEKHTEYKASILILARSKPEDYIYTETETLCYKNLSEKIGDVSLLKTEAKENLVDAVNEIAKKAGSGADLSLGITGANAGQIATVEAVDDQGKPTKWKHENIAGAVGFPAPTVSDNGKYLGCENGAAAWMPVEAPGGVGGDKWELINEFTIPDGAEESNSLSLTKDSNGNDFVLKKALLLSNFPPYTGESTIPNVSFASINGITTGSSALVPNAYTSAWPTVSKTSNRGCVYFVDVSGIFQIEKALKTDTSELRSNGTRRFTNTNTTNNIDKEWMAIPNAIGEIHQIGGTNMLIYPGCWFALYGVRA